MLFLNRNLKSEEGFTLIELLVVIVIIGVLAAIALPIFLNQQKEAIKAGIKSDVKNLQVAVATYLTKHPTAENLEFRAENGSYQGLLKGEADWDNRKISPSSPATILIVRKAKDTASGVGTWQEYVVVAANKEVSPNTNYYYYTYYSTTGKYEESNG